MAKAQLTYRKLGRKLIDLTGAVFGDLTIKTFVDIDAQGDSRWLGICVCGTGKIFRSRHLKSGATKSCGCLNRKLAGDRARTHGESQKTPEYYTWESVKSRCLCKASGGFKKYGAKGITICARWLQGEDGLSGYECFLKDMGRKPAPGYTIERKNVRGNYAPDNCRWATLQEQAVNRTNNKYITYEGEVLCLAQWSRKVGIDARVLSDRIASGWPVKEALTIPKRQQKWRR